MEQVRFAVKYKVTTDRDASEPYWVWVIHEEFGPGSSSREGLKSLRVDLMTWEKAEDAEHFMEGWRGHPWYHRNTGIYEIVKVEPNMVLVQKGWKLAT